VIYETQPSFIVHERPGHRGLLEAAVDLAQHAGGLVLEHDVQLAATGRLFDHRDTAGRSVEPVDDPASG
jgi:hypothetical protein